MRTKRTTNKIFRGVVTPGRGLAEHVMARRAIKKALAKMTALSIAPGTLNVVLEDDFREKLSMYVTVKELGGLPEVPSRKGLRLSEILIA